jgi:hypothetical protein
MAITDAAVMPVAGVDYPRDWPEFLSFFPDERACLSYLERVRWPAGFRCPACASGEAWKTKRGLWACGGCGRQTSVTAGTVLARTRTPLVSWFMSIWQLTNQKHGLSAMGLQRLLGLRSYETAWAHMHKLRRAMVRPGRDQLNEVVEIDESYVGGEESGVDGRQTFAKSLVICAVEVRANQAGNEYAGRIRMSRIPSASRAPIEQFVLDAVERGTRVRTDGLPSYRSLHGLGYAHDPIIVSRTGLTASMVMPHVHRTFALLKRWLLGTYQGGVQAHQLDYYLDEFSFRYNRRHSRHRGLLFYRLLQEVIATEPIPLHRLVGGQHGRAGTSRDSAQSTPT